VEELILEWNPEDPISIKSLGMSQFELEKIVPSKCSEAFQIGTVSNQIFSPNMPQIGKI
jgi:hypothetical protein